MPSALNILAGPQALPVIRERGLRPEDIDVVVGASGGPKWLVLSGLDRVLFGDFLIGQRERPLHLLGSSIGSWRLACLAQRDPVAAQDRFRHAYIYEQRYRKNPSPEEVTQVSARLLERLLGDEGDREILDNPYRRLHLITVLCHGFL
ncbi:MAG: patatin-like phospholipase family protein, partial [Gammaproteobacteria bacterium]